MRLLGLLRRRWVLGGAGAVVLACVAVAVVVVQTGGAACASPAARADAHAAGLRVALVSGKATFYAATGAGNCSYEPVAGPMVVALGPSDYRAGASCGGYLDVTGPKGTVRVKVVDKCPECAAGHIDLSREAFTKIANPVDGIVPVTFRTVANPGVPGPLTVRVKEGSSAYWLALRFDNHGNALASAELKAGNSWQRLERTDFNYWIDQNGAGGGPFTVRLTDSAGRQTVVPNIKLAPEQVQPTGVTMAGGGAAQAASPAAAKPSSAAPPPSASATAGPEPSDLAPADAPGANVRGADAAADQPVRAGCS